MALSAKSKKLVTALSDAPKFGDIKKHGKEIKMDHGLALELWSQGDYHPRLLATLILDRKQITENIIEELAADLLGHEAAERNQLGDWILANQLSKDKKLIALMQSWQNHSSPVLRRWYWYHQARLRWMGRSPPPENSAELLRVLDKKMGKEDADVQWAMNFCAGWIGVYEPKLRPQCVKLGKRLGLYKDDPVARNCTPSYLPEFIKMEVDKRN